MKRSSWFRLSHDLFEDPDFYDFSPSELLAWIYLLCQASRKNCDAVRVNISHLERVGRIKEKDYLTAIRKLEQLQIITVDVTDEIRARNVHGTSPPATYVRDERNVRDERTDSSIAVETTAQAATIAPQLVGEYSLKAKSLLETSGLDTQASWIAAYPDPAWIRQEVNKAAAWITANPKKAPKKFPAFMGNWLSRGWEQFRKTIPSNPAAGEEPEWVKKAKAEEARNAI